MYKMMMKGFDRRYKKRVYVLSRAEVETMKMYNTFVIRETVDGLKVYKSVEDEKHYIIKEETI